MLIYLVMAVFMCQLDLESNITLNVSVKIFFR
jgi:hypothetical protein